jgi:glyoxylase-like metal-dependent hydrolase (beta-lactamase superfamily II)
MNSPVMNPTPSVYRHKVGDDIVITALSDGYLDADVSVLQRISRDDVERILHENFRPPTPRISVNAFLVQSKGRVCLIETGSGDSMGPTLGKLVNNIRAAGLSPAEIDTVLLTHMHPDHSNGLCDPQGKPIYDRAELLIHENEVAHWHDDVAMATAPERKRIRYFEAARRQLAPYKRQLRTFKSGEVFPGVTAVPIPGHTPGHTAYRIGDGADAVLVWGDTVHVPEIQVQHPEVTLDFDSDPDASAAMRRRILEMATVDRLLIAGMHVHFPGFAHVARWGDGYRLIPEPWVQNQ